MDEEERLEKGISRRSALKRIGAAGAIAWATPVISSLRTPAFAASPGPHPECQQASCGNFIPCSSSNPDCVCVSSDQGGFCTPGSTQCSTLQTCPGGSTSECPAGSICAVNTCCGGGVCIPSSLSELCPPGESAPASAATLRTPSGAKTVGG